jgi:anti-sigma factor RsiW
MDHPILEDALERFLNGKASREENRAIVAHLLQGCPSCSLRLQALAKPQEPIGSYEAALDRLEKALAVSLDVPVTVEAGSACHTSPSRRPKVARGSRRRPPGLLEGWV